ncbi:Uncharacterised protein [Mycobacteroides abscessus]|nr:Uncharacterised protein [Mycobacteroides abscessus]
MVVSAGRNVIEALNPPTSERMFCSALIAAPWELTVLTSAAIAALACSWEARGTLLPPN